MVLVMNITLVYVHTLLPRVALSIIGLQMLTTHNFKVLNIYWRTLTDIVGGAYFTCTRRVFVFLPCAWKTQFILAGLTQKYRNVDELKKSGVTICLGMDDGLKIPHTFNDMNIARTVKSLPAHLNAITKHCSVHPQNNGCLNFIHGNFIKVMQKIGHYDDVIKAYVKKVGSTFMYLKMLEPL